VSNAGSLRPSKRQCPHECVKSVSREIVAALTL
jgi:hypothetical protein